jgi:hypothetical protein
VSPSADGTLARSHYRLPDGADPRVLDVLRVPLARARPEAHQPENFVVSPRPWSLVARPAPLDLWPLIKAAVTEEPYVFGRPGDRIPHADLEGHPATASLALVATEEVLFVSTSTRSGMPQARLRFSHRRYIYNLAVTDPAWEFEISSRPEGQYLASDLCLDSARLLLTLSLGEPFEGACYKLVAAIFEGPAG